MFKAHLTPPRLQVGHGARDGRGETAGVRGRRPRLRRRLRRPRWRGDQHRRAHGLVIHPVRHGLSGMSRLLGNRDENAPAVLRCQSRESACKPPRKRHANLNCDHVQRADVLQVQVRMVGMTICGTTANIRDGLHLDHVRHQRRRAMDELGELVDLSQVAAAQQLLRKSQTACPYGATRSA